MRIIIPETTLITMHERPNLEASDTQHQKPLTCPSCEREFKGLEDFPRVFVASVATISPEDVPTELPFWHEERVLAAPKEGYQLPIVPQEVAGYFQQHPNQDKLVHSDSYIYRRPYLESQRYRDEIAKIPERFKNARILGGDEYKRAYNWAPEVRTILSQSEAVQEYLDTLKKLAGQEVVTSVLFPKWEQYFLPSIGSKRLGFIIPNYPELQIHLSEVEPEGVMTYHEMLVKKQAYEEQKVQGGFWVTDIGLWSEGPNMGSAGGPTIQRITGIGQISYQGRINSI